jgi:type VI secretion system protein ImpK
MDRINQITSDCFLALGRLRDLDAAAAEPALVHERLREFVETMRTRAREEKLSTQDADDLAYAIVALADEIAMGKPEPMRGYWMGQPLQLAFFNETLAGEGFFTRLQALRRDSRRGDVLRVYYLCLLLGFQGKYSIRGGDLELMKLIDSLRPEVERRMEVPRKLSPAGEAPDEPLVRSSNRNPFLWVALGMFAIAIALFVGLRLSLNQAVADVAARVDDLNR